MLADAVERHATKDPGTRGTLKRASVVVCHPESEPRKKIALDTEQESPTEDHKVQVHDPWTPKAMTRTPSSAT